MTTTIWGSTTKPVSAQRLAQIVEREFPEEGFLYVGYPVLSTADGANSIDALWLSPEHGVVIFHLVEGRETKGYQAVQDEFANSLETKLRGHRPVMQGRRLLATPSVVTYAPLTSETNSDIQYPLVNDDGLGSTLREIKWSNPELYGITHSIIQSISTIRKGRRRRVALVEDSRGARLKKLEDSVANLDQLQSQAVIETVEGVQRIRGLAGSGKTIILALKAAYLHAQRPDWRIAVTFNTRSLKGQFHRLIETFVAEQTGEAPIWENLQIVNAWGAPGGAQKTGIYYQFCTANGVEFLDFRGAQDRFKVNEFGSACELALSQASNPKPMFDLILVDEAQDFDPAFLRLCYNSLGGVKRLVYAYDELQSLTESSLPPPEEIFGRAADGSPNVVFEPSRPGQPSQDIILEKCYRNSRPVLATAHALGFGIYRNPDSKSGTGLIQMFDQADLWREVGYRVKDGHLQDGSPVTLARTSTTSPEFLEKHSPTDDLIQFISFGSPEEQAAWLADQIELNLKTEELGFDDIIVINPDPLTTVKQVGLPRRLLFEKGIQSHVSGVDTSPDVFFQADSESVAFTGIFRAKGNEAGMVYVMNGQDCFHSYGNLGRVRNRLFTAITRSKAWVRVIGVGDNMTKLAEEFSRVKARNFELSFTYPDEETRKFLRVINRDLTEEEKKKIRGAAINLRTLAEDIEAGKVLLEDLPERELKRLRTLLSGGA